MKRNLYIGIILVSMLSSSCHKHKMKISTIEYSIVDYSLKDAYLNKIDEGHKKAAEILRKSKYHFKFMDNDTLLIDPLLGMKYFGDSIFQYQVSGGIIELTGSKGKKKIYLNGKRTNEFVDIYFENDVFKRMGLLQKRIKFKNNAYELLGTYSIVDSKIGSKYIHDRKGFYRTMDSIGTGVFDFRKNDSLYMTPKFGMHYFGDSIFYYRIHNQQLILDSNKGRFEIPFKGTDLKRAIILYPTDGVFKYLWLTKVTSGKPIELNEKEVFKIMNKNNLKLKGKYGIADYSLGSKYINNIDEGHSIVQRKYLQYKDPFNFINDSIVLIKPDFGIRFFGDTILNYEIGKEFIRFRNKKFKREMNFIKEGTLIRIDINDPEINKITLSSSNTNK